MNERLIVFTRCPEPNRCKTRLIPALGPEGAADLHRKMTAHTVKVASRFRTERPVQLQIEFDGPDAAPIQSSLGNTFDYRRQAEGDLGTRLDRAFQSAFDDGAERVVIVGTDCPGITGRLLKSTFGLLKHQDVVLGPASDGGYYLVGLRSREPSLFDAMPWGTSNLLAETLIRADRRRLGTALLPTLDDVDRPEDLAVWERCRAGGQANDQQVALSVVVPTYGLEPELEATLQSAAPAAGVELIVVAAGERAQSSALARKHGCIVAATPPGRGRQLNVGSQAANDETLLFLHADTQLPVGYAGIVESVLSQSNVVAGAFSLGIDASGAKCGLNDTPKIAALLLVVPAIGSFTAAAGCGVAIALGGWFGAKRIAETLSHRITDMNAGQGFSANLVTAVLVTCASRWGLPVSTTHVSCGALFGIGSVTGQAHWRSIAQILLAWITTLPYAAVLAWLVYSVLLCVR